MQLHRHLHGKYEPFFFPGRAAGLPYIPYRIVWEPVARGKKNFSHVLCDIGIHTGKTRVMTLNSTDDLSIIEEREWKTEFLSLKIAEFTLKRVRDSIEGNKICFEWNLVINEKLFAKGNVDWPKEGEVVFGEPEVAILQQQQLESSCSCHVEVCS